VKLLGVLSIPLIVRDHNINCRFFWSAIRPPEASSTLIIIFFVSRLLLLFSSLTLVCSTRRLSVMYIVSNRRHFSTHKLRSCELIGVYYKIIKILKSTKCLNIYLCRTFELMMITIWLLRESLSKRLLRWWGVIIDLWVLFWRFFFYIFFGSAEYLKMKNLIVGSNVEQKNIWHFQAAADEK
jgi:hypothetical protein